MGDVMRQVQMENIHPLRLKILLEIERTGSISAAAERCGIGQPSASMHLRTLERSIGCTLVDRTGRGSRLTAAGTVVASHAAEVLTTLDSMQWALESLRGRGGDTLTVAASLTPSIVLIPSVLRRFSEHFAGVSVKLRTVPSETVVREVAHGAADIGIAGPVACQEPVVRSPIMLDELIGIAPVGLSRSDSGLIRRDEFAGSSLLLGPDGSSTRLVTERHLARAEYRPARIWAFDSYEAIKRAVADGVGVSFVSRHLLREELERGELARFRLAGVERILRPIHVVQPSVTGLTGQAAAFLALLRDADAGLHMQGHSDDQLIDSWPGEPDVACG